MKAQPNPGASGLGGAPQYLWGISGWETAQGAWGAAMQSMVVEPAEAAMAVVSRYANYAMSQHIQQAHAAALQARDYLRAAAAAATELPPGTGRATLLAALARQEAEAEALMREVLRFGREHGHLAFAFPANRCAGGPGASDH
jgi:hypothetical protein